MGAWLAPAKARIVDEFYTHLLAFPATCKLLEDPETLGRLKESQKRYFDSLLGGVYDHAYVEERCRVGAAHARVGLVPEHYIGAYNKYLGLVLEEIKRRISSKDADLIGGLRSLLKVVFFDLGLALEVYFQLDKKALESLKEHYRRVIASVPSGFLVVDRELKIVSANRSFRKMFGWGRQKLAGEDLTKVLPMPGLVERIQETLASGQAQHDLLFELKGDTHRIFQIAILGIQRAEEEEEEEEEGILLVVEDLTEEERLRREAEELERRYSAVFQQLPEARFVAELESGRIIEVNPAACRLLGRPREELAGRTLQEIVPEERWAQALEFWASLQDKGQASSEELYAVSAAGLITPVRVDGVLVEQGAEKIAFLQVRDMSRQRLDEAALRNYTQELERSRARFRHLWELAMTPRGTAGEILETILVQMAHLLGAGQAMISLLSGEDLVFHTTFNLPREMVQASRVAVKGSLCEQVILANRRFSVPDILADERFCRLPEKLGLPIRSYIGVPISGTTGEAVGSMCLFFDRPRDFGEEEEQLLEIFARRVSWEIQRERAERELREVEKLSALGQLISGVAHDLNNALTGVLGFSQLLLAETGLREPMRKDVQRIKDCGERSRAIVKQLLRFARREEFERKRFNLNQLIDEVLTLREHELQIQNIAVVREYDVGLPETTGDPQQIQEVLLNLINNAYDAILETHPGGTLWLGTRFDQKAGCIEAEVLDDGGGFKELGRALEPFYTTKAVGKGTGLGLSVSYGIIQAHGGKLTVENWEKGAKVTLRLPLADAAQAEEEQKAPLPSVRPGKRILVVDDEPALLELARRVLGEEHEVVTAASGLEAIEKLEAGEYDLVITDLLMPGGVNGDDLYRWIKEHRPGMVRRVVFVTGAILPPETANFLDRVPTIRLNKPYTITEYKQLVHEALTQISGR